MHSSNHSQALGTFGAFLRRAVRFDLLMTSLFSEIEGWNFGITYYTVYRWDIRDHLCHSCHSGGVSFVFLSQASAAPFATTDSGLVQMDSSCVSSQRGRVSS
ncbi:hypothetical protein TNCV_3059021 [Trichonephila clavipes]|nr:hypothetical protein TNCV_3059021 [Trichonephila clavipes]